MQKLAKEEFVIHYMNSIDSLKVLKANKNSIDLIEFFSNIYEEYLVMFNKGKVDEEKIKESFCYKSNLLIKTIEELIEDKSYSNNDIADAIKLSFNAFSWPRVENPASTIEEIYIKLNQSLSNKKVLLAFPGFDDFVLLKEKYNPSVKVMNEIIKNITSLDFNKIKQELKYYYEVLPEEKNKERQTLVEKLNNEKRKRTSYQNYNTILENELEYDRINNEILNLNSEINIFSDKINEKEENKNNLNKKLENLMAKYSSLNHGLNKIIKHKEIKELEKNIEEIKSQIVSLEEEIKKFKQIILEKQKETEELKEKFYKVFPFVPYDKFKEKLEEAKKVIKTFEGYDEYESISLINRYDEEIREIDDFLESNYPKNKNVKALS